nr:hypothetical protein [Tanacetum cinerariifolium]
MTSFGYRLNPRHAIKECSSCRDLYTRDCCCSKGIVEDKILVPKLPKNYARCGHPFDDVLGDGESCQRCTCTRCGSGLSKGLCYICGNNQNSLNDSLSISENSSQSPPYINHHCCYECGVALDGIFCQRCTCKSCGKGAHIGYNCPPKVPIISNPEPCNQTMNNEPPQTLPSFDPTCYSEKDNSLPCVSKPKFINESPNVFNPPPQHPIYSCEFCESNAQNGHYCTPQVSFIYSEPGYSQDFNFPQDFHDSQQQHLCCDQCGGPHETFQCFDQTQPLQFPVIHPPPQEISIEILHDQENDALGNKQYKSEDIKELFHKLLDDLQNIHEELAEYINTPGWNRPAFYEDDDDDDVDYTLQSHPEFEGIPDTMCDVHLVNNPTPLEAKDHFEIVINSNDDYSSSDEDYLYNENIEYVEASPHDSELVSLEVEKIVIPEDKEIEDDNLREKLLKVNLLIDKIEALKDNSTPSSEFLTKSSSTSPKSFLEETNTVDNSLPEFENFFFDLEEISSGSTTTHSDISLSEYDSFIFDLSNDQFPPTDRSYFTHEEFSDELTHIISPPEYDCFYFGNLPNLGEWISILYFRIRENLSSTTCVNLPVEDDHSPFLAYVVWIFLAYLTYPVIPPHLYLFGNKDTIFDPGIAINCFYSFKPSLSHRCGTFKKFNTHRSYLNESPMRIHRKNTPILDVPLFHFYPP